MRIFVELKNLRSKEKNYTCRILKRLMVVEKDRLYADLKYSSLFKYAIKELGYTEAEATIRVNAVKLMLKSKKAQKKIEEGELSLSNAAAANKVLSGEENKALIDKVVEKACEESSRGFKKFVDDKFDVIRRETLVLEEFVLKKFDRLRKKYGDHSNMDLILIMLERELRAPSSIAKRRVQHVVKSGTRYIANSIKRKVYNGKCANCGVKHNLEYDHKIKFSHGGNNHPENLQLLCKSCNLRKEIKARQLNVFA